MKNVLSKLLLAICLLQANVIFTQESDKEFILSIRDKIKVIVNELSSKEEKQNSLEDLILEPNTRKKFLTLFCYGEERVSLNYYISTFIHFYLIPDFKHQEYLGRWPEYNSGRFKVSDPDMAKFMYYLDHRLYSINGWLIVEHPSRFDISYAKYANPNRDTDWPEDNSDILNPGEDFEYILQFQIEKWSLIDFKSTDSLSKTMEEMVLFPSSEEKLSQASRLLFFRRGNDRLWKILNHIFLNAEASLDWNGVQILRDQLENLVNN